MEAIPKTSWNSFQFRISLFIPTLKLPEIFGTQISFDPEIPLALPMGSPLRGSPTPTAQAQPSLGSGHSLEAAHSRPPPPRAWLGWDFVGFSGIFPRIPMENMQ